MFFFALLKSGIEVTQLSLVYEKSKLLCKKVYRKPIFYSKGFLNLCQHNSHLNAKQTKALHDLYTWRDKIARESDESCEYVLKSHQLLKIAELLPREIYGILALCNPISNLLEASVHEMHDIIKTAREYKGTSTSIELGLNLTDVEKNLNTLINKATAPFSFRAPEVLLLPGKVDDKGGIYFIRILYGDWLLLGELN